MKERHFLFVCLFYSWFYLIVLESWQGNRKLDKEQNKVQIGKYHDLLHILHLDLHLGLGRAPALSLRGTDLSNHVSLRCCQGCPQTESQQKQSKVKEALAVPWPHGTDSTPLR